MNNLSLLVLKKGNKMINKMIHEFTSYCLKYPDMPITSIFNRYMHLLTAEQITQLTPYFDLMVKVGETARDAIPEMKELILKSKEAL